MSASPSSGEPQAQEQRLPEGTVAEGEETTPASPEEDFIRLNRKELQSGILQLERENEDFRRLFNTRVGNTAATKYQPIIKQKEQEIEQLRNELFKLEVQQMNEQEVERKFSSDPIWARKYTEAIHQQPPQPSSSNDDEALIIAAVNQTLDFGRSYGLSDSAMTTIQNKASNGAYDIEGESWQQSLQRMQGDILDQIAKKNSGNGTKTPPTINKSITEGGPDLSPKTKGGPSAAALAVPKTVREFNDLPKSRQLEILSDEEGMKAVEALAKGSQG